MTLNSFFLAYVLKPQNEFCKTTLFYHIDVHQAIKLNAGFFFLEISLRNVTVRRY